MVAGAQEKLICGIPSYKFRSDKHIVLAGASSGITSLLLPGGKTAYSVFKIPL